MRHMFGLAVARSIAPGVAARTSAPRDGGVEAACVQVGMGWARLPSTRVERHRQGRIWFGHCGGVVSWCMPSSWCRPLVLSQKHIDVYKKALTG
jgi:hypothetical protein